MTNVANNHAAMIGDRCEMIRSPTFRSSSREKFSATNECSEGTKSRAASLRRARMPLWKVAELGEIAAPHGYLAAWIYVRIGSPALSVISQLQAEVLHAEVLLAVADGRMLVPGWVERKQSLRRNRSIQLRLSTQAHWLSRPSGGLRAANAPYPPPFPCR
jgi:hypothetical protein